MFNNPFEQFQPLDFSLWAHPAKNSKISETPGAAPLGPTTKSPLYPGAPGEAPAASTVSLGGVTLPAPQVASTSPSIAPGVPTDVNAINQNQSLFGKIHDKIRNTLTGDAPQGYEGMLTPQEIAAARPNLTESLFSGGGEHPSSRWRDNLNEVVANKQQAAGVVANQRVQAATQQIFAENPPPKSGTPEDFGKWANKVVPALAAAGNFAAVKELSPLVKELDKSKTGGNKLQQSQAGDIITSFDPEKGFYDPRPDSPTYGQWVAGITRGVPAATVAHNQANEKLSQERIDAQYARLAQQGVKIERGSLENGLKEFDKATAPIVKRAPIIEQALLTLDRAAHAPDAATRKTLYSSSVANFVQAADQNAQLRIQLLQYFQNNVDKSVAGQWNILKDRMLKGELPQYSLEAMIKHIQDLRDLEVKGFNSHREGVNARRPYMGSALPTADEYFPSLKESASSNDFTKWGITPVRKP